MPGTRHIVVEIRDAGYRFAWQVCQVAGICRKFFNSLLQQATPTVMAIIAKAPGPG
jgi:hypothetical protein